MEMPKGLMAQIQKMQQDLIDAQEALKKETVTGSSGGGAVVVTLTGDQRCTSVTIDPAALKTADAETLQDLMLAAFNNALEASRALAMERLGPLSSGMNL